MKCIQCGNPTRVLSTRQHGEYRVKRARTCGLGCLTFQTFEVVGEVYTDARDGEIAKRLRQGQHPAEIVAAMGIPPGVVAAAHRRVA